VVYFGNENVKIWCNLLAASPRIKSNSAHAVKKEAPTLRCGLEGWWGRGVRWEEEEASLNLSITAICNISFFVSPSVLFLNSDPGVSIRFHNVSPV
jgi:hypothetical protein